MKNPHDVPTLRSYLGMIQHYSKFVPRLAEICAPLYELLKANAEWKWTNQCDDAVKSVKSILATEELLAH